MILDGIDVFVSVVQAGGFSAAARQLGMPATTVSARIARLEERLGTTLIQRSTRRMHVTEAGERYFEHCLAALASLQEGEDQLAAGTREPSGILRITAPPDLSQILLPPMVQAYLGLYPRAEVELVITNSPLDLLAQGIDLAVRASPMRDSSLLSRKLASGSLALFASADYLRQRGTPRHPDDLAGHTIMAMSRVPTSYLRLVSKGAAFDLIPTARVKIDDMQTLRAFVALGSGIGLLPDFVMPDRLTRVLPEFSTAPNTVFFVYPAQRFVPVRVRAFVELAIKMQTGGA
jgi:DNA-binding transcriptional LysR family regulator